jgi:hypothetical protein
MFVTTSVQLSVAVAVPFAAAAVLASQLIVTSTGHVIAGLVVSCTVKTCVQLFELPQLSTAIQSLASV